MSARLAVMPLTVPGYVQHPLHGEERIWPETNCYVDLWIEVLHSLGLDPVKGLAFTISCDFDGEQWEFFKYPLEDLRFLYGLETKELNVWRGSEAHVVEHMALGHLVTVEVDSWYLPDTAGVAYRLAHQKTTIVPNAIDPVARRLEYFHNRGYFELEGDDYDGVFQRGVADALPPYAEVIRLDRMAPADPAELDRRVDALVKDHLGRRPARNPIHGLAARVQADVEWLGANDEELFHRYAFGTLRQCGSWAECLATFLGVSADARLRDAGQAFVDLATDAKACQFKLARAARGRRTDLGASFETMAAAWDRGYQLLADVHGG